MKVWALENKVSLVVFEDKADAENFAATGYATPTNGVMLNHYDVIPSSRKAALLKGLDVEAIRKRAEAATGGPWTACCAKRDNGCSHVMHSDGMIAEVTKGPWGDEYPALRAVDEHGNKTSPGAIGAKVEPYIEMIEYGDVSPEQANKNKIFIAHAREDVPALLAKIDELTAKLAEKETA